MDPAETVMAVSCVPDGVPTKPQWWAHSLKPVAAQTSWLISVGHKTKQEGVNVRRKALGGRRCNRGRREVSTGHREAKQKAANVCEFVKEQI